MKIYALNQPKKYPIGKIITRSTPYQLEFTPSNTIKSNMMPVPDFPRVYSDTYTDLRINSSNPVFSERAFKELSHLIPEQQTEVIELYYETSKFFMLEAPVLMPNNWVPMDEFMLEFCGEPHVFKITNSGESTFFSEFFYEHVQNCKFIGNSFFQQIWPRI